LQTNKLGATVDVQQRNHRIGDKQLEKVKPILEVETEVIHKTVEGLRKLQLEVDEEFFPS